MPDAELLAALKKAKGTEMFFAFVPKGQDGKLIISKVKIRPQDIADARKELGGATPILGKCYGDGGTMVFEVAKPVPPAMVVAIKRVAKRETGLNIAPEFRQHGDED
jgi:hypothetical protein